MLLAWGQDVVVGAADAAVELGSYKNSLLIPWQAPAFSHFDPEVVDLLLHLSKQVQSADTITAIGHLIDWLSQDAVRQARERVRERVREAGSHGPGWPWLGVTIEFRPDCGYSAIIKVRGGGKREIYLARFHEGTRITMLKQRQSNWPASVLEERFFNQNYLDILADCWRDTKAHNSTLSGSSSGSISLAGENEPENETPTLAGAGVSPSHLDQVEGDEHPTAYPSALAKTRGNGRSLGSIKASPEASALGHHPQHRTVFHVPDHHQPALA